MLLTDATLCTTDTTKGEKVSCSVYMSSEDANMRREAHVSMGNGKKYVDSHGEEQAEHDEIQLLNDEIIVIV